ncbi:MAG: redox-sensing transcriptional repressor Rex [Ignavibacteria bacterium]|nr:redox-sensing transcriptional repressor Rex [Ignavibacteria bacterium]
MKEIKIRTTPEPTLRRLPRYYHLLLRLKERGINDVSSTVIAKELDLDPTQVRKDIEYTEIIGRPKTGYNISDLIKSIRTFLSWDTNSNAVLVGTGSLGTAMLGYKNFSKYGLNFIAAFDIKKELIGKEIHGVKVYNFNDLKEIIEKDKVTIGVLAVPVEAAQEAADKMIKGGIKAIWNYAPCQLKVDNSILVENAQLSQSLAVLTRKITELYLKESL